MLINFEKVKSRIKKAAALCPNKYCGVFSAFNSKSSQASESQACAAPLSCCSFFMLKPTPCPHSAKQLC